MCAVPTSAGLETPICVVIRHVKAQLEDLLVSVDMALVMWTPLRGGSESWLQGQSACPDPVQGSNRSKAVLAHASWNEE